MFRVGMSMKHNRIIKANRSLSGVKSHGKGGKSLPPVAPASDVRPDKVAKAKELISREAYPPSKVVQSLAEQIARFF